MAGDGGARPGAGRKPKAIKHETAINRAEKQIKDKLPEIVDRHIELAFGGIEQVEEKWVPAGTVMIGTGEYAKRAYPEKPFDELVLIERKVSHTLQDRAAGQYLINRILGTPTQKSELTGKDGGPIETKEVLTDDERRARIAAIFERARARGAGQPDNG